MKRFLGQNRHAGLFASAVFAAATASLSMPALSASKTYTFDADFSLGLLENVNFTAPNSNQLQVNIVGVGSKFIFIANHDESSVSKFDTVLNREVARYRTYVNPNVGSPSRIAIDVDGNAYVLNREPGSGLPPQLLKILVDTAVDRNGNASIDTSVDTNNDGIIQASEMLAFTQNDTGANNAVFADERIAWARRIGTGTSFGRSLCIAPDGKLWVGVWDQSRYYRVEPSTGAVINTPSGAPFIQVSQWNPYGCTIDKNGILWSATLSNRLGRVDTNTGAVAHFDSPFGSTYGISQGGGKVYQANSSGRTWTVFDPATSTFSAPASVNFFSYGIAIDGDGNVLSSNSNGGVAKHSPAGALIWQRGAQPGASFPLGVMIDGNNDVWVMNISSNNMSKFRGTDGAPLGQFPTGAFPYVYTDGSGLTTKNETFNKQGTWTVVYDSGIAATPWGKVSWNSTVPSGAAVNVEVRSAESAAALDLQSYVPVGNNAAFNAAGRYLQIRTRLVTNADRQSPILYDLTVASKSLVCDVNTDGSIDSTDINLIRAAIGQTPVANDPRDANSDGLITINDARACTSQCTRAKCATAPAL